MLSPVSVRFSGYITLPFRFRVLSSTQDVADEDEGHLRKVFEALDLDGNGEITVEELQQVRYFSARQCCETDREAYCGFGALAENS